MSDVDDMDNYVYEDYEKNKDKYCFAPLTPEQKRIAREKDYPREIPKLPNIRKLLKKRANDREDIRLYREREMKKRKGLL
ncbi:MAG: hypothetical protein ACPGSG_11475 [Prolixibacteraceae bacterium]